MTIINRIFRFYVNRFSILYAGTGAVNALIIDGWLYLLTHYAGLPLPVSTLIAVVTSIFTDYTWKSKVVFRSSLLSRGRFSKYFLNGSAATIIQYVLTLVFSTVIAYTIAYILAVAIGFLFAYTISRLKIWHNYVPASRVQSRVTGREEKDSRSSFVSCRA
jgi:putative flippase GtrA